MRQRHFVCRALGRCAFTSITMMEPCGFHKLLLDLCCSQEVHHCGLGNMSKSTVQTTNCNTNTLWEFAQAQRPSVSSCGNAGTSTSSNNLSSAIKPQQDWTVPNHQDSRLHQMCLPDLLPILALRQEMQTHTINNRPITKREEKSPNAEIKSSLLQTCAKPSSLM